MTNHTKEIEELSRSIREASDGEHKYHLLLRRATAFRKMDQNKEAAADYFEIVDHSFDKNMACHAKAMISLMLIESREYHEALWWAASSYDNDPTRLDTNTALGLALVANEFHQMAIPYFRYVSEKDRDNVDARRNLGICLRETMDFQGAHDVLTQIAQEIGDPRTYYELGWNWHLRYDVSNNREYAKVNYLKALNQEPSDELKGRILRKIESLESVD